MDPTNKAYIDPAILEAVSTGTGDLGKQDSIPSLGVASPAAIKSSDPNVHYPAVAAASLDPHSSLYADDLTSGSGATATGGGGSLGGVHGSSGGPGTTDKITSGSTYPDSSPNPYPSSGTGSGLSGQSGYSSSQLSGADTHKSASSTLNTASNDAANKAAQAKDVLADSAQTTANKAASAKDSIASSVEPTVQGLRTRVNQLSSQASTTTQQVAEHPAVQNAKQSAERQVGQFREFLGNFPVVKDLEKRTGVDRVVLVAGGVFAYILLVPLNLFGLALPVTQFLTFVPPTILALDLLERRESSMNDEDTKTVLAYFVVLGLIQFVESLAPGLLASWIPQYWTVKLIFLAYLIHPQTKGALKIHNSFLRNFVAQPRSSTKTPPTSNPFNPSSPTPGYSTKVGGSTGASTGSNPFATGTGVGTGAATGATIAQDPHDLNIPKSAARGEGFEVVSELR